MPDLEWETPPQEALLPANQNKYTIIVQQLIEKPGEWAVVKRGDSAKTGQVVASQIRSGKIKAFAGRRFEAAHKDGTVWARYMADAE